MNTDKTSYSSIMLHYCVWVFFVEIQQINFIFNFLVFITFYLMILFFITNNIVKLTSFFLLIALKTVYNSKEE